jgi:hypothetical protein
VLFLRAKQAFEDLVVTLRPLVTERSLEAWLEALRALPPLVFLEQPAKRPPKAETPAHAQQVIPAMHALEAWFSSEASSTDSETTAPAEDLPPRVM